MKKINKISLFLLLSAFTLVGCNDLLDVDSNRLVFTDEYQFKAANDTLYSMFGIFSQLEKLSDSYVLLGELRGDLMTVTDKSSLYLKEINNYNISDKNPYTNNIRDYYSVINNCNYVIHNIDTSVVAGGKKVMYREYAACKAIRAWTYMQIALNYGSVTYYDQPILSLEDANKEYPVYTMNELAPILIQDLIPLKDIEKPVFGSIFTYNTAYSFFPIRFLLGDLYLWTGQYENAATEYHDLMLKNSYIISSGLRSTWQVTNYAFTGNATVNWVFSFNSSYSNQLITSIASTNQYSPNFEMDSLTYNNYVTPSDTAINNWKYQQYYYSNTLDTLGDLRSYGSVSLSNKELTFPDKLSKNYYIMKYQLINPLVDKKETSKQVIIYRTSLLYLRYAEAVNRLNKPNLALAVLKNGMNQTTLQNRKLIPQKEMADSAAYMNFSDERFTLNIGIHMLGSGNVNVDTTYYKIPNEPTITDSVEYVENLIVKELALETAFEGNRFQDLMRVALRRNDPAYLANRVAAKYQDNKEAIRTKLMQTSNWYLKK